MTKKMLLTVVAVSVLSGSLVFANHTYAQTNTPQEDPMTSLVQKIADKFNLNKDDVQGVFDQNKKDMDTKREQMYEQRLDKLVADGKINASQKQLLLDKHKELMSKMQSNKDAFKDLTPEQRKAKMDAAKQDIENWAKENGIDAKYLMMMGPGMRGHGGFVMHNK